MAFDAGAAIGHIDLNTKSWMAGLGQVAKSQGKLTSIMGGIGTAVAAVGAAVVSAITVSVLEANKFQKAFSNVTTVIDTTQINTQALAKEIIGLDARLGDTVELTEAVYQAFSAGAKDAKQAMDITVNAAKFGKAGLTDTATAVDVLTTATNAYGSETVSAGQASDIFFKTIQRGKVTGQQLSAVIGKSIPLFASTGIELGQLGAGLAAMTLQGVNAAEATTQLNAIVKTFIKPTAELSQVLANVGYSSGAAFIEAEGLTGALNLLNKATKGDAAELAKLLPEVEALRGTMALTGKGAEAYTDILKNMGNATGATDEAFKKQELTFETLENQSKKLMIVAGNIGKVFADELAVGATQAADSMLQFFMSSQGAQIVSDIIANIASAFEVFKLAIQPIIDSYLPAFNGVMAKAEGQINKIPDKIDGATTGMTVFASVAQFTASAIKVLGKVMETIIGVIGNLVTAIIESGATIGSFFEFLAGKKSWDEVSNQAAKAGEAFKNFGTGLVADLDDVFKTVGEEVVNFGDKTAKTAKKMDITWTTTFSKTKSSTLASYDEMITGQSAMTDTMIENANKLKNALITNNKEITTNTAQTTQTVFSQWWQIFSDLVKKAGEAFNEAGFFSAQFGQAVGEVINEIDSKVQQFGGLFSDVFSGLSSISDQYSQNELTNIDNDYQAKKKLIEKNVTDEEERTNQLTALEEDYNEKQAAIKTEQFKNQKKASVIQSIIDGISSVSKTLSQWGFPWGLIPAGIMGGIAAANTAAIASQPVPTFALGGIGNPGPAIVGEAGPEMINIGSTSRIIPASQTEDILTDNQDNRRNNNFMIKQPFIMQLDAKPIYRGLFQATKNGIALISGKAIQAQ